MTALATEPTRVYMPSARTAHLVLPEAALSVRPRALCRIQPYLGRSWFGTGSHAEYETAATLPLCPKCETAAGSPEGTPR